MNQPTMTLTQSGLLAVLLEHHRYNAMRSARRLAHRQRLYAVLRSSVRLWHTPPARLAVESEQRAPQTPAQCSAEPEIPRHEVRNYAELQHQIHEDLRNQHPDWVQPNGDCPMCDLYEARLKRTLEDYSRGRSPDSVAAVHRILHQMGSARLPMQKSGSQFQPLAP